MKKTNVTIVLMCLLFSIAIAQQTPDQIAREWIEKNQRNLKIANDDVFMLKASRSSLSGHTLRYQQTINNIPVYDTEITIHVSKKNKVTNVADNYDPNVNKIDTSPVLQKTSSIDIAKNHINAQGNITTQESNLFVYNKMEETKLVHVVHIKANLPLGYWEVIIDAKSGEVLKARDISIHEKEVDTKIITNNSTPIENKEVVKEKKNENASFLVDGTGMVFNPDPLSASGETYGGNFADNNDATNAQLDAARSSVILKDIDFTGGVYTLKGPYVEIRDIEGPNNGLFTQTSPDFNFNRSDNAFEAVNCYYHLDKSMRYINETLGIDLEALTNNGVLIFDPSGWNGADNSSYGGGQLSFGEGCVDDGEDADVILHELGHGLHDWLTNGSLSQVDGLSEGCGDYWAQSYKRSLGQWQPSDASYQYVFGWDGNNECWPGRSTGLNVNGVFPSNMPGGAPHGPGQVWATTLMKVYDIIGREKVDKAFLEGLAMTNGSTGQEGAAIAVRQAAIDMGYSCADVDVFTTQFTTTGYNMPPITLTIDCPGDQLSNIDPDTSNFTIPDYTGMTNAVNTGCNATMTQDPAPGTTVTEGTYTITVTATAGSTVSCNFELTVGGVLSTEDFIAKTNITAYPIPANNKLVIDGEFKTPVTLEIYNLFGQKTMNVNIQQNVTDLDISKLAKGVYFITFKDQTGAIKFIKN